MARNIRKGTLAELCDRMRQICDGHLAIAEAALRHVRRASLAEADRLLRESGLEWVRTQDFWILFGGPLTDTASMKGPYDMPG